MSLFPTTFTSDPNTSFTPLFRLLDDFDTYNRASGGNSHHRHHQRVFQPKFDVKETVDAYELHGELPGIDQKDVEIEFTDQQTLTIRGHVERSYTSGTPPSHRIEGSKSSGQITEGGEKQSHKATVEDESEASKTTSVATQGGDAQPKRQEQDKFWVSERSVGEFVRSFSFPTRVNQDAVKASMKNGILSIIIPKAKKQESRKIQIS